ncbi:MAG: ATP-binding protein [bacterium]
MKIKFNSIKFKISILYTAILGAILVIYCMTFYLSLHHTLYKALDEELRTKAQEISNTLSAYLDLIGSNQESIAFAAKSVIGLKGEYHRQGKIKELEAQWLQKVDKLDLKKDYINLLNPKGEVILSSSNLKEELLFKLAQNKKDGCRNIIFRHRKLRVIDLPFIYKGKREYIIQVATSIKPIIYILQNRLLAFVISLPIALLLISFIGWLFAMRILRPVEEVAEAASNITYEDLSSRVMVKHPDEEMKSLIESFNEMISRLESSFRYITEFSSHVAHELKTPLAIIRGESEVALRKERNLEEYQRVIKVNLEETERMVRTIDDMLLLAKLDYRPELFKFEQFDLIPFFEEIYEQSKILASQKDIMVSIDMPKEPMYINADSLHLRRLFFNLIHNAIKFNSPNGRITITLRADDEKAVVWIRDTGVGIGEEDLPKIFDKFFHIEKIDQGIERGSGLGLAIAQSIAKIHDGSIEVESQPGEGSIFKVVLPLF